MIEARIIDLQIQPFKGGGPLKLEEARMTKSGLETVEGVVKDHFLVVVTAAQDAQGFHNFLTQRMQIDPEKNLYVSGTPQLALVRPESRNGRLVLNFNGQNEVEDPGAENDDPQNTIPVQVWEYQGGAIEIPKLSEWLSDSLQRSVKVARTSGPWNRMARQNFMQNNNPLRAQDGYPVHMVAWEDAEAVFQALGRDTNPNRFRYQILVEGLSFQAIHNFDQVEINGVTADQPKPCDRCEVTGIDQETGEFSKIKPLSGIVKAGGGYWVRPDTEKKVLTMGENLLPNEETIIRVGDVVTFMHVRSTPLRFERPPQRASKGDIFQNPT